MAGCAILLGGRSVALLAAAVFFTGFAFSAIYPTTLAMIGDRYQRFAGTVFGVLFAIGLAGGAVFPWAVGHISQAHTVRTGMVLPLAGACAVAATVIVIKHRLCGKTPAAAGSPSNPFTGS
jgi:fucose permease